MEKSEAAEWMKENLKLGDQINAMFEKANTLKSDSDIRAMRFNISQVIVAIDENLFRPIIREFPDLDPHR